MKPFDQRWEEIGVLSESPAFQRVDDIHPLDFYLGRDITGEWILLLVTDQQSSITQQYRAIHVVSRFRQDGRWALMFQLKRPELAKIFSLLCEDLVESSRSLGDSDKAVSFVMARFNRWQKLLERGRSGLLELHELRGLIGELLFLERVAIPKHGIETAVSGWVGPRGADQDFVFDGMRVEVKTIREGASAVRISSAEQLDVVGRELKLAVVVLEDFAAPAGGDSFDALELVGRLRSQIEEVPAVLEKFEDNLLAAGFLEREEYAGFRFLYDRIRVFGVNGDFPRIIRTKLIAGIGAVSYEVNLENCLPFEETPEQTTE